MGIINLWRTMGGTCSAVRDKAYIGHQENIPGTFLVIPILQNVWNPLGILILPHLMPCIYLGNSLIRK